MHRRLRAPVRRPVTDVMKATIKLLEAINHIQILVDFAAAANANTPSATNAAHVKVLVSAVKESTAQAIDIVTE